MHTDSLFEEDDLFGPVPEARAKPVAEGLPRLRQPNRRQVELRPCDLEALLPEDHQARLVWEYVERQDLSALFGAIKARGRAPGRAAIDPRILFGLWLYATLNGVGSGREIVRLTQSEDGYRWLCGGVSVNYHGLNDFRSSQGELFDRVLSNNVAALAAAQVITLRRVAQDGVRVRANAGASSFRRRERLNTLRTLATELVRSLKEQAQKDPGAPSRRAQAARERAAEYRARAIEAALAQLSEADDEPEAPSRKASQAGGGKKLKREPRASTTDAQARVMKMADGGFRPAYNVQYATDCESQVVVGVEVVNTGSDMAQLAPMLEQVEQRLGQSPEQWLVDGGFPAHAQIDAVSARTEVIAPVPKLRQRKQDDDDGGRPPAALSEFDPRPGDSDAVIAWRTRMKDPAVQEIYKLRAATAECVNAQARQRGLQRLPVRGLDKVRGVALLYALAHNLMRTVRLAPYLLKPA